MPLSISNTASELDRAISKILDTISQSSEFTYSRYFAYPK
jgi:hypothetical protein